MPNISLRIVKYMSCDKQHSNPYDLRQKTMIKAMAKIFFCVLRNIYNLL